MNTYLEAVSTSDPIYDEIVKKTLSEYPRACICMIDRVVNPRLEDQFQHMRAQFTTEGKPADVYRVYHGTKQKSIDSIVTYGFLPEMGRIMAYGYGIYFAKDFRTSYCYTDGSDAAEDPLSYMFLCDVLPGRMTSGLTSRKPPPGYDSQGNSGGASTSTIFAIPLAGQMVPRFLVRFHKDSERIGYTEEDDMEKIPIAIRRKMKKEFKKPSF